MEKRVNTAIREIDAFEILDSRGWPTLRVKVTLAWRNAGVASVPAGASTGQLEAVEHRDGDAQRYSGKGTLAAARTIREVLSPLLAGTDASDQVTLDRMLIGCDGTSNKARIGANAILGVSLAAARAAAAASSVPLYRYLDDVGSNRMPVPMVNVVNGGKHANNSLDFQEFMIVPHGAPSFSEAIRYAAETFHALGRRLAGCGYPTSVGDEGGFAPTLQSNEEALELISKSIEDAGYEPGRQIAIALDPAASSFFKAGSYHLTKSGEGVLSRQQLLERYKSLCSKYPIVSIEDGFAEDDWEGFETQTAEMGSRLQVVGDDLYVTNSRLIAGGLQRQASNAVLIKLNQIGTLTETNHAVGLCRTAGWNWIISHRSGETEDTFIADYAVAKGGGQIKTGSICRSERLAKYNRLIEIERELGSSAEFTSPFAKHF
ncbi:MAG: phosphopyruvate hydratase [Hyphomicrobium sp.]|uniref:phosphopyruvate hydratase n=1 Tax=Hyphomicrobium sp. TaxID=82 RepID=UPI0039E5D244